MSLKYLKNYVSKISGKLPLRVFLVVPFMIQIVGAVSIVGYISFRNGQEAVNDVASQLRLEISDRIKDRLNTYLKTPLLINQINLDAIRSGQLNLRDSRAVSRYFWRQIQLFDSVTTIYFSSQWGELIGAGVAKKPKLSITMQKMSGDKSIYIYASDNKGNPTRILRVFKFSPNYDFRQDVWYRVAVRKGKPTWTPIYPWVGIEDGISIDAVMPVYNSSGELQGVLGSSLILVDISKFLKTLKIGNSGIAFIIDKSGDIVASSTLENPFTKNNHKLSRLKAERSTVNLISLTARNLTSNFGNFNNLTKPNSLEFKLNNKRHFVRVTPIKDKAGIDWLIVVVVPEADFMQQINANNRTTILLCCLAFFLATLMGIMTSRWIVIPILKLEDTSLKISAGNFNQRLTIGRFKELMGLAKAFNQMASQLQESFEKLETRVEERTSKLKKSEERERQKALELEQTLRELQITQAMMIQAEKMSSLGQMVAGIAHEINNPVTFIHGNINHTNNYALDLLHILTLYQKYYPNPPDEIRSEAEAIDLEFIIEDLPKSLKSMQVGTERINQIVTSLRNFSRLDEAERKKVNIHEGIDSTLLILQNRLKARPNIPEIKVIKCYGDLPLVECYAGQLNQVFMNIINNAIDALNDKFSKSSNLSNPEIRISTKIVNNNVVEIRIADNGLGMIEEVRQKIFDPFFTTKPVGQGTGLGLAISYQIIVEKHGGKIESFSQIGEGCEFAIAIPLQK